MQTQATPETEPVQEDIIFLSIGETAQLAGASRRTIYNWVDSGVFPQPVKLSPGKIAFVKSEVTAWQRARMAERAV